MYKVMTVLSRMWAKKNYRFALIMGGFMLLWLSSGVLVNSSEESASPAAEPAKIAAVRGRIIAAQDYALAVKLRARTEPNRAVDVKAEVMGRVIGLPVEKGDIVALGDVICELSSEDRAERVEQFNAVLGKARLDYDGALRLKSGGYQSRTAIADALSRLETAKADAKKAKLDLANLKIRAPFAGVVDVRPVEIGDFMQRADICARVLDMAPLLVAGRVAEASVAKMQNHSIVKVVLAGGKTVEGKIRFIERNADEITRTFRLEALVENNDLTLRSGLTAQMVIPVGATKAHLVSASLLALDDQGQVGVKVLDGNNVVSFHLVQIIGDESDGVWVQGLPEHTTLITVGQQYVTAGETVALTLDSAKTPLSAAQL